MIFASKVRIIIASLAVILVGLAALMVNLQAPGPTLGFQQGLDAIVATTSNPTITTTGVTLFATSSCSGRTITTVASPIMLTFSDRINQTPTGLFGHLQAASTTITYPAEQYGCGLFKAFGFVSSAITVTEYR